jgi:hypothetical protein
MSETGGTMEIHSYGTLFKLDDTGDTRLQWNLKNPEEVEAARTRFNELKKQGYTAYTVDKSGDSGEVIHTFDPKAERIIFRPHMIGG